MPTRNEFAETNILAAPPSLPEGAVQLSRAPIYRQIAERLKQYIIDHDLKPGDKLPTEQELAAAFHVGRSSVREALRFLQALDVIHIRQRHGVEVRAPILGDLLSQLAYGLHFSGQPQTDLWEARLVLESGSLPLVISRATASDLQDLADFIVKMDDAVFAADLYARLDMEYHRRLILISNNAVIQELAKVIEDFFSHPRNKTVTTPAQRRQFTAEHQQLCQCISRRDLQAAQAILSTHLWRYHAVWGKAPQVQAPADK